jgi:hypothetical protein
VSTPREVTFVALFDTGEGERLSSRSMAPTGVVSARPRAPSVPSINPSPRVSIAPAAYLGSPARESTRSIPAPSSVPVIPPTRPVSIGPAATPSVDSVRGPASAALSQCAAICPGYREAVLVISMDVQSGKARLAAQLVAISAAGRLEVLDTPSTVMDAAVQMCALAGHAGEITWRRLVIRLSPKAAGAGYHLAVEAVPR